MARAAGFIAPKISTNVAAENDKTLTVPADEQWYPLSVMVELVTSATVGNRRVVVECTDGSGNVLFRQSSTVDQAAGTTRFYNFGPNLPNDTTFVNDSICRPLTRVLLPPGYKVRARDIANIDAADTLKLRVVSELHSEVAI